MPTVEFGSRAAANRARDKPAVKRNLAPGDDRRSTTVKLKSGTPRRVIDRVQQEAFTTTRQDRSSAGMAELGEAERKSIKRQHPTFNWRQHGFQAMRAKAALQRKGVTEWLDFWEPGESPQDALGDLQRSKKLSAQTGAKIGVEQRRTDEEELEGLGRRQRQTEEFAAMHVKSAREPAILEQDPEAVSFLREQESFDVDPFDLQFVSNPEDLTVEPVGQTAELVRERNQQRSKRAREQDKRLHAPITRDPVEWAENPDRFDFPGVDTIDPEAVQATRSKRSKRADSSKAANVAESVVEWAKDPSATDLPGVDTPL